MSRRRLLVLATYPRTAAATRYRACAYFPALERAGIDAELRTFLTDEFASAFYRPGGRVSKALGLVGFSLKSLVQLARTRGFHAIFVQREAALIGPAFIESMLSGPVGLPMIFDMDDALWVTDVAASRNPLAARLLKSPAKTNDLLSRATEVIVCTNYLASYARRFSPRVTVCPTVVSSAVWQPLPGRLDGKFAFNAEVPTIGWVGTHSTATHLDIVVPALRRLADEGHRFRVRLVGAMRTLDIPGIEVINDPWVEKREIDDFQRIDIGIAPVRDGQFSRGKGGFKQIQYMTVGVPMVSSSVGGAQEVVRRGENALIAETDEEWTSGLRRLLTDQSLRAELARNGRALVERELCSEVMEEQVVRVVERAMNLG
jgi:hypothetical protein